MSRPDIHPSLRHIVRAIPSFPYSLRTLPLGRFVLRRVLTTTPVAGVRVEGASVSGSSLRLYTPSRRLAPGAILWIHGGGLVSGHPLRAERRCSVWARDLGVVVASVHYRLAPEHPYPAAIDDCHAAFHAFRGVARLLDFDPARIVVGGDSAGGGLAACLTERLVTEGGPVPAGQVLVYPMVDDRTAANRTLDALDHPVWCNRSNRFGWRQLPGRGARRG